MTSRFTVSKTEKNLLADDASAEPRYGSTGRGSASGYEDADFHGRAKCLQTRAAAGHCRCTRDERAFAVVASTVPGLTATPLAKVSSTKHHFVELSPSSHSTRNLFSADQRAGFKENMLLFGLVT
ncbi:uncharacterized protein [Dermacentor albipictus]|uniref:uncharacterized protein n=1 Tax=Dermacentor albipictus TaxID=60249 RepID=UPI0031FC4D19